MSTPKQFWYRYMKTPDPFPFTPEETRAEVSRLLQGDNPEEGVSLMLTEWLTRSKNETPQIGPFRFPRWLERHFRGYGSFSFEFKPQDLWVGAFFKKTPISDTFAGWDLWICILPCFPIHIWKVFRIGS